MHFELTTTVEEASSERVLSCLETHLRAVAADIVRVEGKLTALGIGPSPRVVNRKDTTVVEAQEMDGTTVLSIDVTYQASALLGAMSQDSIVEGKIEGALLEMRRELGLPVHGAGLIERTGAPVEEPALEVTVPVAEAVMDRASHVEEPVVAVMVAEPQPEPAVELEPESVGLDEPELNAEAALVAAPVTEPLESAAAAGAVEPAVMAEAAVSAVTATVPGVAAGIKLRGKTRRTEARRRVPPVSSPVVAPVTVPMGGVRSSSGSRAVFRAESLPELPVVVVDDAEVKAPRRVGTYAALTVVLLLLAGTLGYELLPRAWTESHYRVLKERVDSVLGRTEVSPPAVQEPTAVMDAEPDPAAEAALKLAKEHDPDVTVRVQDWANAMRSRDAAAQASFYADPVERYFLQLNVSNAEVLKQKQADIQARPNLFTVKIEDVVVEKQSDTEVVLRLVKHYITQASVGAAPMERLVRSRLRLKRIDDEWKIVEERDFKPE